MRYLLALKNHKKPWRMSQYVSCDGVQKSLLPGKIYWKVNIYRETHVVD
jgi:hypothetical protein